MKVLVACLLLVAVVVAERCHDTGDCRQHGITTCGNFAHVVCDAAHQCECTDGATGSTCTSVSDCPACPNNRNAHCVDSHCHCSRF